MTNWRETYVGDDGKQHHIADTPSPIKNFAWIEKHLGVSRDTLERARAAGLLEVVNGNSTRVTLDTVYRRLFLREQPTLKKDKTYAKQKPIRPVAAGTVELPRAPQV